MYKIIIILLCIVFLFVSIQVEAGSIESSSLSPVSRVNEVVEQIFGVERVYDESAPGSSPVSYIIRGGTNAQLDTSTLPIGIQVNKYTEDMTLTITADPLYQEVVYVVQGSIVVDVSGKRQLVESGAVFSVFGSYTLSITASTRIVRVIQKKDSLVPPNLKSDAFLARLSEPVKNAVHWERAEDGLIQYIYVPAHVRPSVFSVVNDGSFFMGIGVKKVAPMTEQVHKHHPEKPELFIITKGSVRYPLYSETGIKIAEHTLSAGDMIMNAGVHGSVFLAEETEIIGIPVGPFDPKDRVNYYTIEQVKKELQKKISVPFDASLIDQWWQEHDLGSEDVVSEQCMNKTIALYIEKETKPVVHPMRADKCAQDVLKEINWHIKTHEECGYYEKFGITKQKPEVRFDSLEHDQCFMWQENCLVVDLLKISDIHVLRALLYDELGKWWDKIVAYIQNRRFVLVKEGMELVASSENREYRQYLDYTLVRPAGIRQDDVVLDIGTTLGDLAGVAAGYTRKTVHGIDISSKALKAARKFWKGKKNMEFSEQNVLHMDFADASINKVLASYFFVGLLSKHKMDALREIYRVLKSGGRIGFLTYTPVPGDYCWSREQWIQCLEKCGFTNISIEYPRTINFEGRSMPDPSGYVIYADKPDTQQQPVQEVRSIADHDISV